MDLFQRYSKWDWTRRKSVFSFSFTDMFHKDDDFIALVSDKQYHLFANWQKHAFRWVWGSKGSEAWQKGLTQLGGSATHRKTPLTFRQVCSCVGFPLPRESKLRWPHHEQPCLTFTCEASSLADDHLQTDWQPKIVHFVSHKMAWAARRSAALQHCHAVLEILSRPPVAC